jgi:hypothetical protein
MKKIFALLALVFLAGTASAQVTSISEIDVHRSNGSADRSVYWATGLSYATAYGTLDGYVQGVRATTTGVVDNLNGFETGYTAPALTFGKISVSPRIAAGSMGNINMGDGTNGSGHYLLSSAEADYGVKSGLNFYVSYSHMRGLNFAAISSQNRLQTGLDFTITPKLTVRAGYSILRQYADTQQGVVTMAFYSF